MPRSETLQNVYCTGIVGSYGGGDANKVARQYWVLSLPLPLGSNEMAPYLASLKQQVWHDVEVAYEREKKKVGEARIVRVPPSLIDKDALQWELTFQISSHLKVSFSPMCLA